ncbi:MAG: amidohydrolase family protein [Myxococcota bacterium]|nr:amidohydrolase family protein [Myxococcota bacterium]
MRIRTRVWIPAALLALLLAVPARAAEPAFDLVLRGGRVIDPESGLDAVRDVGVRDGRIAAISETPLAGAQVLDARSRIVAPGFIDLHSHSPTPLGQRYQVLDGVTTALELEAGAFPVDAFGSQVRDGALIHYGASVGYGSIRLEVKHGLRRPHLLTDAIELQGWRGAWTAVRSLFVEPREVFEEPASPAERGALRALLEAGLDQGGLGIGLPLDYISEAVDADEIRMIFEVAGARGVPVFVHVRRGVNGDPAGLYEVLELARETGAAVHVCHVTHNAMRSIELFLAEIRRAREEGADVTTELLPYNAGSALISSAVFGRDWQTIFDITYEDVEWAETGERFDREMWERYRKEHPEGQVIHHYLREEWTRRALVEPGVIVVSDLLPMETEESKVAPHNGAFAKVLGRYVREAGLLDWSEALARMTRLPAQRLEGFAPAFARKGRVQVGADADLTVFDPATVIDRATYRNPYQPSAGIVHVVVAGTPVVRDGALVEGVHPGRLLRAE